MTRDSFLSAGGAASTKDLDRQGFGMGALVHRLDAMTAAADRLVSSCVNPLVMLNR